MIKKRVILFNNIPDNYRFELFDNLSQQIEKFKVVYLKKNVSDRVLHEPKGRSFEYIFHDKEINTLKLLEEFHPDIIFLFGINSIEYKKVLFYSYMKNIKIIFVSDSNYYNEIKTPLLKRFLKYLYYLPLTRKCKFIYGGEANKKFWEYYGCKNKNMFFAPFTVNNSLFDYEYIKKDYTTIKFFFIGRLVSVKNLSFLINTFIELNKKHSNISLHLIGDGVEKDKLINLSKSNKNITFYGNKSREDISTIIKDFDIFILPSTNEPWGLVVNEVMFSSKPILLAETVGSRYNLLKENENGFLFSPFDQKELLTKMEKFILNTTLINEFSLKSFEISRTYTLNKMIKGYINAIEGKK